MIKDIIVNVPLRADRDKTTRYAASMAGYFNAHICGIAFKYEPVIAGVEFGVMASEYLDRQEEEATKVAQDAISRFEFEVRGENIQSASQTVSAQAADAPDMFAAMARCYDVSVVAQSNPEKPGLEELFAEAALFGSGRPVIMVPYIQAANFRIDRVAVAWDGSRQAARAVADAMPFLRRASNVDLVTVAGDNADPDELAATDIADHLARHGLKVRVNRIPMAKEVAPALLNFISDNDIDFMVMGGYGHSRLREFVLGGATRGILQSMTVPVLMSH